MNWYLKALNQYAVFNGRARRKEYWMFVLFNFIFALSTIVLDNLFGTAIRGLGYGPVYILYVLAVFIPGLAVSVRRLHDVGKSGWMILISLIPLLGSIWLLVLLATDSDPGENEYGPSPKGDQSNDVNDVPHESSNADMIIFFVVIWMFISSTFWAIFPKLIETYYETLTFQILSGVSRFVWAFVPLGLAFAIKDKSKQVIVFVLSGLCILMALIEALMYGDYFNL